MKEVFCTQRSLGRRGTVRPAGPHGEALGQSEDRGSEGKTRAGGFTVVSVGKNR